MSDKSNISQAILSAALKRGFSKTTCPSEVARSLYPHNWRNHMEEIRSEALLLQQQGKVKITQKGKVVTKILKDLSV